MYLENEPLSRYIVCTCSLPESIGHLLALLTVSFAVCELFNLMQFSLFYFYWCCLCCWCQSHETMAKTNIMKLSLYVFFIILSLLFKSSVHFELIFVCGNTWAQIHTTQLYGLGELTYRL